MPALRSITTIARLTFHSDSPKQSVFLGGSFRGVAFLFHSYTRDPVFHWPRRKAISMETPLSPEQREALIAQLKEPFHPNEIHWRVLRKQKDNKNRGEIVAYVKSSAYRDRLTELFTTAGWTSHCETSTLANITRKKDNASINTGKVMVAYSVTIHGLGTHSSTGEEWADDDNALTTAEAQAFKRACAFFGLGAYIANVPKLWVDLDNFGNIVDEKGKKAKPQLPDWALPKKYLEQRGSQGKQQPTQRAAASPVQQQSQQNKPPAQPANSAQAASQSQGQPANAKPAFVPANQTGPKEYTKQELERLFGVAKSQIGTALFTSITTMVREGFEQGKYTGDKNTTALEFMTRAVQTIQKIREVAAEVGETVFTATMDKLKIRTLSDIQSVADLFSLHAAMESEDKALKSKAA